MTKRRSRRSPKTTAKALTCVYPINQREAVNMRLASIVDYAKQAQRTSLRNENFYELVDLLEEQLQEVIALVRRD